MQISYMQNILFVTSVKVSFNFEGDHEPQIKDCSSIHGFFFNINYRYMVVHVCDYILYIYTII